MPIAWKGDSKALAQEEVIRRVICRTLKPAKGANTTQVIKLAQGVRNTINIREKQSLTLVFKVLKGEAGNSWVLLRARNGY